MKISEAIDILKELMSEYGDLNCICTWEWDTPNIYYVDSSEDGEFIAFE